MLDRAVSKFGDAPYSYRKTDEGWVPLSFRQTREDSRAVARGLRALGISPGGAVAIVAEGSPEWIAAEYATLYCGCRCVPLSFRLLPEEIPFRINHSASVAIFVSRISLDSVLSVYDQLETRPLLVYLDADESHFNTEIQRAGLTVVSDFGSSQVTSSIDDLGDAGAAEAAASPIGSCGILYSRLRDGGRVLDDPGLEDVLSTVREDDVATISYSSGTTGNPKGIMLTHLNYYTNCRDSLEAFPVPGSYRTLIILPCDHSFAHTVGIYAALTVGLSIYFVDARGGSMGILRNIPTNLAEVCPDFILTVPAVSGSFMKKILSSIEAKSAFVERLFKRGIESAIAYHGDCWTRPPIGVRLRCYLPYKLADLLVFRKVRKIFGKNMKFFLGGGALLEIGQQQFFKAIGIPVYQGYGLTEATPVISTNAPGRHKLGSSGKLLPNLECRMVGEADAELPGGVTGQILIRGDNVMKGYYRNPEETAHTLKDGWLHTGDLGYFDSDGFLVVTGREKALLISDDGEKYSPEEIEEAIVGAAEGAIAQVMLYNDHRKYTSMLVVADPEVMRRRLAPQLCPEAAIELLKNVLKTFRTRPELKSRFPRQWVPSTFQFVGEPFSLQNGLMNSTSKVIRYKVENRYRELFEFMYSSAGAEPLNERNLASAREMLGVP